MKDNQSVHANRNKAVLNFMDADPLKWNTQTIIVTKHDALEDSQDAINALATIQEMDISGNAQQKALNRLQMSQKGITIAAPLAQWAKDTGDHVLFNEIDFSFSDLYASKDLTSVQRNQLVHDRADTNIAALTTGDYGVDAAILTAFQALIDGFNTSISTPRDAESVTVAATTALDTEVRSSDELVSALKRLMRPLQETQPDFYNGFTTAAKLVDIGSHKIYAQVIIVDDITGERIPKGSATLVELNLEKTISIRGVARFKDIETGTFTLNVESPSYTSQSIANFVITGIKTSRITVRMKR